MDPDVFQRARDAKGDWSRVPLDVRRAMQQLHNKVMQLSQQQNEFVVQQGNDSFATTRDSAITPTKSTTTKYTVTPARRSSPSLAHTPNRPGRNNYNESYSSLPASGLDASRYNSEQRHLPLMSRRDALDQLLELETGLRRASRGVMALLQSLAPTLTDQQERMMMGVSNSLMDTFEGVRWCVAHVPSADERRSLKITLTPSDYQPLPRPRGLDAGYNLREFRTAIHAGTFQFADDDDTTASERSPVNNDRDDTPPAYQPMHRVATGVPASSSAQQPRTSSPASTSPVPPNARSSVSPVSQDSPQPPHTTNTANPKSSENHSDPFAVSPPRETLAVDPSNTRPQHHVSSDMSDGGGGDTPVVSSIPSIAVVHDHAHQPTHREGSPASQPQPIYLEESHLTRNTSFVSQRMSNNPSPSLEIARSGSMGTLYGEIASGGGSFAGVSDLAQRAVPRHNVSGIVAETPPLPQDSSDPFS
eukprot:PhM_4_TR15281/c0_g2_i1/m.35755